MAKSSKEKVGVNGTGVHWSVSTYTGLVIWVLIGSMVYYNVVTKRSSSGNTMIAVGGAMVAIGSVQGQMVPAWLP